MAIIQALLAVSSVAVVLTAGNVQAQSMPPEGPVSVTFTVTQIPPLKPMPIGDGKEFAVINQAMTASNDAGNPVPSGDEMRPCGPAPTVYGLVVGRNGR